MRSEEGRSSLCNTCTSINIHQPYSDPEYVRLGRSLVPGVFYRHHDSLLSLEASTKHENCSFCGLVLRAIHDCIIQDSADDWTREAGQMGRIYRDATVTIFAAAADGDDGGCFVPRCDSETALFRTPMFDPLISHFADPARSPRFVQAKLHHLGAGSMPLQHSVFENIRQVESKDTPLGQRGWVLQEQILSFRPLVYDKWEVRWTCPEVRACECVPEGFLRKTFADRDRKVETGASLVEQHQLSDHWLEIVQEFSNRKLTFGKDKLPAMAGLAAELSQHKKSLYLAGLWKEDLREILAWSIPIWTDEFDPIGRRLGAPSWSWASVDGEIRTCTTRYRDLLKGEGLDNQMPSRFDQLVCDIIDCWVKPQSQQNPFGEIHSGALILRGRMSLADCGSGITTKFFVNRTPIRVPSSGLHVGWLHPNVRNATNKPPFDRVWCMPLHNDSGDFKCIVLIPFSESTVAVNPAALSTPTGTAVFVRVGIIAANRDVARALSVTEPTRGVYLFDRQNMDAVCSDLLDWLESGEIQTVAVV